MTEKEAVKLCEACLAEYEPELKVDGAIEEPLGRMPSQAITSFTGSLDSIDEKQMRYEITKVLDELRAQQGFRICEPDPLLAALYKVNTVRRGNLNLSFLTMFDAKTLESFTHIVCRYFPVLV